MAGVAVAGQAGPAVQRPGNDERRLTPQAGATVRQLRRCVEEVTVEEFRIGDFRVERDAAYGRQLLFLLTNEEWLRRTSEQLELSRVRVVDTEVVVDVDLSLVTPAALDGRRPVWLPVLAVPPAAHGGTADPVTSLEVTDASGARVFKLPQSEVHRRFAAAVAELVLARLPSGRPEPDGPAPRDELVLLAAGVRRLLAAGLAGSAPLEDDADATDPGLLDPAGDRPPRIDTGRARAEERLEQARTAVVAALDADAARAAPLVASRLLEMLDALVGVVFVVVPADPAAGPTSFAVRLPGRRLRQVRRRRRLAPRARLQVALLTASAHADRIVRLTLPDGIVAVGSALPDDDHPPARIDVQAPRPVVELAALVEQVLHPRMVPGAWVQRRLASLAVDKVEAVLELVSHYLVPADGDDEEATRAFRARLRDLRERLLDVVGQSARGAAGHGPDADGAGPTRRLEAAWSGGAWLPERLRRRLAVNTATPGLVHLRATMVEGSAQRARTVGAGLDLEIAVADSTVLDTARDTNLINAGLLVLVTGVLLVGGSAGVDRQTLATVLTLFPAVQAGRIGRPDRSTVRGLLSQPTYLLSLATAMPPLLLATALATLHDVAGLAVACTVLQLGLQVLLRRRPSDPDDVTASARSRRAAMVLTTEAPPDLARLDVLRGTWCRTLVADALLLGRQASAWVAVAPDEPAAFGRALAAVPAPARLHGLVHTTCAGHAVTFTVASASPVATAAGGPQVVPVRLDPGRQAAVDPPAWVIEILLAAPPGVLAATPLDRHPLALLARAAAAEGFPVIFAQHPTPAPAQGPGDLEWLRLRVGVPFVSPGGVRERGRLGGLRRFLVAVEALRYGDDGARRPLHVYAVPELATYEATQTAPDDAWAGGGAHAGREGSGLVTAAATDAGTPAGLPLVLCATARPGFFADVLGVLARRGGVVAGVSLAVLHGTTVVVLTVPAGTAAGTPLGAHVREVLAGTDDVQVPVDATGPDGPAGAGAGAACLARLNVRVPDRPQRLPQVLAALTAAAGPVHVWSALVRVVEGRSLQGRLVAALADTPAWTTTELDGRPPVDHAGVADGHAAALEDDPVVTVEVLRTVLPG